MRRLQCGRLSKLSEAESKEEKGMAYKVQFVGLVCFLRENGGRHVLLPDGRDPGPDIDPHFASIVVAPEAVEKAIGWEGDDNALRGWFALPPCSLSIEGTDTTGTLDTSAHDGLLPELKRIDPNFEIDPDRAKTIATLHVRQGTLTAYAIPGGSAAMSQLDVPFDGTIHVTVTPADGSAARTLRLAPGTEIALANMARGGYAAADEQTNHFQIYKVLSTNPVSLTEPSSIAAMDESPSAHMLFTRATPIGLNTGCSNTGCCSP
jgi:hypothetical protein